jgi:hypothetical protein
MSGFVFQTLPMLDRLTTRTCMSIQDLRPRLAGQIDVLVHQTSFQYRRPTTQQRAADATLPSSTTNSSKRAFDQSNQQCYSQRYNYLRQIRQSLYRIGNGTVDSSNLLVQFPNDSNEVNKQLEYHRVHWVLTKIWRIETLRTNSFADFFGWKRH